MSLDLVKKLDLPTSRRQFPTLLNFRRQQQDNERPDTSGNSLMSEFMNVRDTKFTSLSPANKQRFLLRKWW